MTFSTKIEVFTDFTFVRSGPSRVPFALAGLSGLFWSRTYGGLTLKFHLLRLVVKLLYSMLYDKLYKKSTTNRSDRACLLM